MELTFAGNELDNSKTLLDYYIDEDAVLKLNVVKGAG